MSSRTSQDGKSCVALRAVDRENWREVAALEVTKAQRAFVAQPTYYLALCCYGDDWRPLAIYADGRVIGFMMWAVDETDGSCWLGGILIDRAYQRRGYGREAVLAAVTMLSEAEGYQDFALSYSPLNNVAQHLYRTLGFVETDRREGDELVARLSVEDLT